MLLMFLCVLCIAIIIINIRIRWTGDIPFKLKDTLKSVYIKHCHKLNIKPLNKKYAKKI